MWPGRSSSLAAPAAHVRTGMVQPGGDTAGLNPPGAAARARHGARWGLAPCPAALFFDVLLDYFLRRHGVSGACRLLGGLPLGLRPFHDGLPLAGPPLRLVLIRRGVAGTLLVEGVGGDRHVAAGIRDDLAGDRVAARVEHDVRRVA